jgi:hypothetical protein
MRDRSTEDMRLKHPIFALRIDVGVGLVIAWNALGFWGVRLNGGMGRIHKPDAVAVFALACGLLSVFFLAGIVNRSIRDLIAAESRRHLYKASGWGLLAAIPGLMGLLFLATLLGWLPSAGLER